MATTSTAEPSPDKLASLKAKSQALNELYSKIHHLRVIPHTLLRPRPKPEFLPGPSFLSDFQQIKEVTEMIKSETVQQALKEATDSEKADKSDLRGSGRRENRKRRRAPSPPSPQPYVAPKRRNASLFPEWSEHESPLEASGLQSYLRTFNAEHKPSKVQIWRPTRESELDLDSMVLRVTLPDVLLAYVKLWRKEDILRVDSVTVFGPREKKSPHSQSSYQVYQALTQQLATMVQLQPHVSIQSLLDLLLSYSGLFYDPCTVCKRVLSTEGHIPPVVRVWTENEKKGWEPRWSNMVRKSLNERRVFALGPQLTHVG